MRSVVIVAYWESFVLLAGFFAVVLWKLFTAEIPLGGLLEGDVRDRTSAGGFMCRPSAGRAQSLTIVLFVAVWYLIQVIHNPTEFPPLSESLLGLLAASQAVYLGGKAQSMFLGRLRDLLK
jgi:hypothetical protein